MICCGASIKGIFRGVYWCANTQAMAVDDEEKTFTKEILRSTGTRYLCTNIMTSSCFICSSSFGPSIKTSMSIPLQYIAKVTGSS